MQYEIRYTSFEGAAGNCRLDTLDELPGWLWDRPGTHILGIELIGTPMVVIKMMKIRQEVAMAKFAEGLLDSLQNYRGA